MLQRLYDWTMRLAGHRHALWWLALVAFVESSVFPIPPDVMLVPMILAQRRRAWLYAGVATAASVVGGMAGYGIGLGLYEALARPLLEFYGYAERFAEFQALYETHGGWVVFTAGITPFPYKVITIASGAVGLALPTFIVASVLARGLRFFVESALLWRFGPPIRDFIEKRLALVMTVFVVLLVGGFLGLKFFL
jgi:membrane protein YqaA with SNARE-associated domain